MLTIDRVSPALVRLVIDRPPANALTHDLIRQLLDAFVALGREAVPPAVILAAEGERFFSAGGDIREVTTDQAEAVPRMRTFHKLLIEMESYGRPIVCAVNGYAVGAGLELVLHSDCVVSAETAQFGFPEINNGLLPAAKGIRQAVGRLGRKIVEQLLYTGDLVGAERALAIGLIDELVTPASLQDRAVAHAERLSAKDHKLFAAIKNTLNGVSLMTDPELEERTIADMVGYLGRTETAAAREKFLQRKAGQRS